MSLLVTGSIGIDTVVTPYGTSKECVGGSAVYFSMSASSFTPVRFLGVIGDDCPFDLVEIFKDKDIDLGGLEVRQGSKTFRWHGSYAGAMNEAQTERVDLNVLAEAPPAVPDAYKDSEYVFLANTSPVLQMQILSQIDNPKFVAADTMNLWIETAQDDLEKLLKKIDMLVLNDGEAKLLTGQRNVITAAKDIIAIGPKYVVIKRGEYGSLFYGADGDCFILPAYPTENTLDPTGAGDSFAGGLMGYLAKCGRVEPAKIREAVVYGTVASSYTISDFSIYGIRSIDMDRINERFDEMRKVTQF